MIRIEIDPALIAHTEVDTGPAISEIETAGQEVFTGPDVDHDMPNAQRIELEVCEYEPCSVFENLGLDPNVAKCIVSKSFESLPKAMAEFMRQDGQAQKVTMSSRDAENCFPSLIKRLFKFLLARDFDDVKIIEVRDCKLPIDGSASEEVFDRWKKDHKGVNHAVVKVNSLIIDPCRMRMGNEYVKAAPPDYGVTLLPSLWREWKDVSKLATMTPEDVRQLREFVAKNPHHNLTGGEDGGQSAAASDRQGEENMILKDISLAAALTPPEKFYWSRYSSDRAMNINLSDRKIRIEKGTLFGVREIRKTDFDEVLLTDGTRFKLAVDKAIALLDKGKEYRGNTPKIAPPVAQPPKAKAVDPMDLWAKTVLKTEGVSIKTLTAQKANGIFKKLKADGPKWAKWLSAQKGFEDLGKKLAQKPKTAQPPAKPVKVALKPPVVQETKPVPVQPKKVEKPQKVKLSQISMPTDDDLFDSDFDARQYVGLNSVKEAGTGKRQIKR